MRIVSAGWAEDGSQLDLGLLELSDVLDKAEGLGTYEVQPLYDVLSEVGKAVESPAFDPLYEKLVDIIRKRRSEGEAGEAYIQRAFQKLNHKKPYEAIRWFGRAEELLIKEEYRPELILALLGSSDAFNDVGLAWAARNKVLAAVERTFTVFADKGEIIPHTLVALQRLVWAELRLGRVPHIMNAMQLAAYVAASLKLEGKRADAYSDERREQEAILGIHLLKIPVDALPSVSRLHDGLERAGLSTAAMALLFSLGQRQGLRDEGYCHATEDDEAVTSIFEAWLKQPAAEQIADTPLLFGGDTSNFKSIILGCAICVEVSNNPISIGVAESLLGSLEAFLATSDETDIFPHCEELRITVAESSQHIGHPTSKFLSGSGRLRLDVTHAANYSFGTAGDIEAYHDWLREIIIQVMCRIAKIRDPEAWMERAGQERAFSRALALADTLTLNKNIFGETPTIRVQDHIPEDARHFAPLRTAPLKGRAPMPEVRDQPVFGTGALPADHFDREHVKHTDRRVLSPIDVDLWDQAGWRGVVFEYFPDRGLPLLALGFANPDAGKEIFQRWIDRWGDQSGEMVLRLAIITGVCRRNPGPTRSLWARIGQIWRPVRRKPYLLFLEFTEWSRLRAEISTVSLLCIGGPVHSSSHRRE